MAPRPTPTELQQRRAQILEELMRSQGQDFLRRARRFSSVAQDADDAIDDACVAFMRHFDVDQVEHAIPWMMVTIKHAALSINERNKLHRRLGIAPFPYDQWDVRSLQAPDASPEERSELREWMASRADLLAELKADERTALLLFAYGFSYLEIANANGWTHTKVNRCLAEGRARLRELLSLRGESL